MLAATATVAAAAPSGDVPWSLLRRPLHLPLVAAGSPCPVSRIDRRVPWARIRIFGGAGIRAGAGLPGLGTTSGLLNPSKDTQYGGPWQGQKVFWYIAPTYRGRVLIRGRRLDGAGLARLSTAPGPEGRTPDRALRHRHLVRATRTRARHPDRRARADIRLLRGQIDGKTFSKVVVFTIDLTP